LTDVFPDCYHFLVMRDLNEAITEFLKKGGASLVGFADLLEIDAEAREGFPYGISIAAAVDSQVISQITDGPTRQYYDEYRRLNSLLDRLGQSAADFIREKGYRAAACPPTFRTGPIGLSAKLSHKAVATRAGLGWVGKCALLITRRFGSAVRLTTVLTDAPLTPGRPVNESSCARCTRCVDACPGQAVTGKNWQPGMPRESLFNAFACRETAFSLSEKGFGIHISICGRCIVACPWTQKYILRTA
jgi:epoxyqueuosine reductase QueG